MMGALASSKGYGKGAYHTEGTNLLGKSGTSTLSTDGADEDYTELATGMDGWMDAHTDLGGSWVWLGWHSDRFPESVYPGRTVPRAVLIESNFSLLFLPPKEPRLKNGYLKEGSNRRHKTLVATPRLSLLSRTAKWELQAISLRLLERGRRQSDSPSL